MLTRLRIHLPQVTVAALLLTLPIMLPLHAEDAAGNAEHFARIQQAVADVPYMIDAEWAGQDIELPSTAIDLLRPNAILSRRYQPIRNNSDDLPPVDVLVVHCADTRDMGRHHPPVCYPAVGWTLGEVQDGVLDLPGRPGIPTRVYHFSRLEGDGIEARICVQNFFITADGSVDRDRAIVERWSERPRTATRGITQVQIITAGRLTEGARSAGARVLDGMDHLLERLGFSGEENDE